MSELPHVKEADCKLFQSVVPIAFKLSPLDIVRNESSHDHCERVIWGAAVVIIDGVHNATKRVGLEGSPTFEEGSLGWNCSKC